MEPTIPPQSFPTQPITPTPPITVKPKSSLLTGFIVIILLLFLGAVGLLVYQNRQLKQQIAQVQPTPTPLSTPITTPDPTANWKTYTNQKLGITFKYPQNLFFSETALNYVKLAFEPFPTQGEGQGSPYDSINIFSDNNALFRYNILLQMKEGETKTGIELHDAEGEIFTKIRNTNFGTNDAIEYIQDGITQINGATRGYIPYAHTILIRKNDSEFIYLVNQSEAPDKVRQHDTVFNQILSTFKFISTGVENITGDQIVTGKVLVLRIDNNIMTVQSIAESTKGNITQMMVWTDSNPTKEWQKFSTLINVPLSDKVYAKYKDNFNNESPIYSDSPNPEQGPPPPVN